MVIRETGVTAEEQRLMDEYPRPDFLRPGLKWESLNGPWKFAFDDEDTGLKAGWQYSGIPPGHEKEIKVPYVFQCPESGINLPKEAHEVLWYERSVKDLRRPDQKRNGDRLILRFGAVDYECEVWVDGAKVGAHRGGHVPFEIDITACWDDRHASKTHQMSQREDLSPVEPSSPSKNSEKRLNVRVFDSVGDLRQPRGKQYWKPVPENIFYTPSSGIWQNVWMEVVPRTRIGDSSVGTVIRGDDIATGVLRANVAVLGRVRREDEPVTVEMAAKFQGASIGFTKAVKVDKYSDDVALELPLKTEEKILQQRFDEIKGRAKDKNDATQDLTKFADDQALLQELESKGLNKEGPREIRDISGWRDGLALWSPEHPNLYEVTIRLRGKDGLLDGVKMWVGMRSVSWQHGDATLRLNNEPYFHALLLDQGYWPNTLMTPPDRTALKDDIVLGKAMGFNGCRKHQKVEDPVFLHYADKLGYLVWGEMGNAYAFDARYAERFDQEWKEAVRRDINHASVVVWTPVNESWGYTDLVGSAVQRDHIRSLYYQTKTLDPTRPINDNCGWEHISTDLTTFHDYADGPALAETCSTLEGICSNKADRPLFVECAHVPNTPILCTEFGGVNIAPKASVIHNTITTDLIGTTTPATSEAKPAEKAEDWGYTTAVDPADLLKRFEALVMGVVQGGHICGFVYTQLSDIEQEVNGLYTFDRRPKLDAKKVKEIVEKAKECYFGSVRKRKVD